MIWPVAAKTCRPLMPQLAARQGHQLGELDASFPDPAAAAYRTRRRGFWFMWEGYILIKFFSMLVAVGLLLTASAAATPITFRMSVPNASGVNNLVPFTNQTIALTVQADTSQVIPLANLAGGGPGNCVPANSTLISVGGGVALQAAPPVYFCATVTASIVGVFTTSLPTTATVYFAGNYSNAGITNFVLASDFPLTSNVFSLTKVTSDALNLTGGGTASVTVVPDEGTTFAATLSPTSIPTLGEIELAALFVLLALAGMMALMQRRLA